MIHQFGLRHGSAGLGEWHGGEGVIRELEFLEPMQVSILSEVQLFFSLPLWRDFHPFLIIAPAAPDETTVWIGGRKPRWARDQYLG